MWKVDSNFIAHIFTRVFQSVSLELSNYLSLIILSFSLSYRLFLYFTTNCTNFYPFNLGSYPFISSFYVSLYRDLIFDISSRAYHFIYLFTLSRDFSSVYSSRFRILLLLLFLLLQATRYLRFNPEQWKSVTITSY